MWDSNYRLLQDGEEVLIGDEMDSCRDGWKDDAKWVPVYESTVGNKASDPAYPSHTKFRRKIEVK